MTNLFVRRIVTGRFVLLLVAVAGCHAREEAFYEKVFTCRLNLENSCGTTRDGAPMTCFPASQLGGEDFCAAACDVARPSPDPGSVCMSSGALLLTCRPDASKTDPALGCPSELQCYRTDLVEDEGVCIKMHTCTDDADCGGDPTRRSCAASIVRALFPSLAAVDSLQCVQPNCRGLKSSCQPGEVCLTDFLSRGADFPDICVPTCDAQLHCPPNSSCSVLPTPSGQATICVPGLLGSRCEADQDCAIGDCRDTGAGFSECLLPTRCRSDLDCAALDGFLGNYLCAESAPGQAQCVAVIPFHGLDCLTDNDCPQGHDCFFYSPYGVASGRGECRWPCGADLTCPSRGGVPHVCLSDGMGGCYPSDFALPCRQAENCRSGLSCELAQPNPQAIITDPTICTAACTTDTDCTATPAIHGMGFCEQQLCRVAGQQGAPCNRDAQCLRHLCVSGACVN